MNHEDSHLHDLRRRAEEALNDSEAMYRMIFAQAGDYILVLEMTTAGPPVIRDVNEAAQHVLGYARDELVGKPISLLEPEPSPETTPLRQRLVLRGQTFEVRHRRKDGSFFDAEVKARELTIKGRRLILAIERDITERKRAEEQRVRLESQLHQGQKTESVGRLAGGVALCFGNAGPCR